MTFFLKTFDFQPQMFSFSYNFLLFFQNDAIKAKQKKHFLLLYTYPKHVP